MRSPAVFPTTLSAPLVDTSFRNSIRPTSPTDPIFFPGFFEFLVNRVEFLFAGEPVPDSHRGGEAIAPLVRGLQAAELQSSFSSALRSSSVGSRSTSNVKFNPLGPPRRTIWTVSRPIIRSPK